MHSIKFINSIKLIYESSYNNNAIDYTDSYTYSLQLLTLDKIRLLRLKIQLNMCTDTEISDINSERSLTYVSGKVRQLSRKYKM